MAPANLDAPCHGHDAAKHLKHCGDARAFQTSEADYLAGAQSKINFRDSGGGSFYPDRRFPKLASDRRPRALIGEFTNHSARDRWDICFRSAPVSDDPTVAEHGQGIGELKDFVQAVRDEDYRRILTSDGANGVE
jgi:hypothetical protein